MTGAALSSPDFLDPVLDASYKGYPATQAPRRRSEVGSAGWNLLAGDLPLPVAVLRREALEHNLGWMQSRADAWGVGLAPHGKTSMSPQLFRRQLDAGAWGITFANVTQLAVGVAAGVRHALIANQVLGEQDLQALRRLLAAHDELRVAFLVDSLAQVALIEAWHAGQPEGPAFDVLLEIGFDGGRTGLRHATQALQVARGIRDGAALRLVGIECYEGLGATGDSDADRRFNDALMDRVEAVARQALGEGCFEADELIVSAGGSAIYDLVATRLRPALGRPVRGLLRSGCYLTHDHGSYQRFQRVIDARLGCDAGQSLRAALEVWAVVQSCPEPGLAIVSAGKRDLSFDLSMPVPIARAARGSREVQAVPAHWQISALNDQHAYLRYAADDASAPPEVGERIGLGISHPCTTFDKWRWMPVVEADYTVSDAIAIHF